MASATDRPTRSPESDRIADDLLNLMFLVERKLIRPSEQMTRDSLSPIQFQALWALIGTDPQPMTQLARSVGISKQQLTPIVDKLEGLGYLERSADPADRRVVRLGISRKGWDYLDHSKEDFAALIAERLATLAPDDRERLAVSLVGVNGVLGKLG